VRLSRIERPPAEVGSLLETAMEAIWIGGVTFFGLGALILEDP
jgi:hypothetical protein